MNAFKRILKYCGALVFLISSIQVSAQGAVELLWFGQSAFKITTPSGKVIVVDPWIQKNPVTPPELKNLETLGKVDLVLVTHAHWDHMADAVEIAKRNSIPLYGPGDLNQTLTNLEALPAKQLPRFNKGGTIQPFNGVKVTAVHAEHSSTLVWKNPATEKDETHPGGEPLGFIIELENGFKIYHAGDTDVFGDMNLIRTRYQPDLVLLPIGGNFTMDPKGAALAVNEYLKPKFAIPMHYKTNPLLVGTPEQFIDALGKTKTKVVVMSPGQTVKF